MSDKIVSKGPCDECGSSDANTAYEDGSFYCYSCEHYTHPRPTQKLKEAFIHHKENVVQTELNVPKNLKVGPLPDRGLVKDTLKKYGAKLKVANGVVTEHFYPYHDKKGNLVAWKTRIVKDKTFPTMGDIKKGTLFGQHLFSGGGRYVTICEGEIDTMSVYQMTGSKYTCVGIKNGAQSAYRECKAQSDWLDTFENIVICMDNDAPGNEAAQKIASIFPKKSTIIKMQHKDAGEYLEKGDSGGFTKVWWAAEKFVPDDIITGTKMWDIINASTAVARWQYPWDGLNSMTYGLRTGELVLWTAGSGMGKTTVLRELVKAVKDQSDDNLGLLFLEESDRETGRGIMSIEASIPFHLPDAEYTPQQLRAAYERTWGTERLFMLDGRLMQNDVEYIIDRIKYLAIGQDCKFFILDHVSFMVSDQSGDERKMLDEIAHKLKAIAVEQDIHISAVVHTKRQAGKALEEGGHVSLADLRGTAGLGQLANMVIGLERNGQAEDLKERNTTMLRVVKNRFCGRTGPATKLFYDETQGRLIEQDIIHEEEESKDA